MYSFKYLMNMYVPWISREIREAVDDLEGSLESMPKLVENLNPVRQETITHSQVSVSLLLLLL